jgi:hypothetical protein
MIEKLTAEWQRLTETISEVHNEPLFVSEETIKGRLLPCIAVTTIILSTIYCFSFNFVDRIVPANSSAVTKSKMCYQIANICFNTAVGCVGIYLEYWVLPTLNVDENSPVDKIIGHEKYLFLVSAMQLGYQAYAIPVGVFFVNESTEMIMHHFAVVISSLMSGFLSIGFRYYSPFFYGVMELSSLPLSAMNTFKDNPDWIKKSPTTYALIRGVFAISFLTIRNVMCASRWPWFLRDNFIVMYTKEWGIYKGFMFLQCSLAFFLAFLQLLWGSLILRGIVKLFIPGKKEDGNEKKNE